MPIQTKKLRLNNISSNFDKLIYQNQNDLLSLLKQFIKISDFIPFSFYQKYHSKLGKNREYSLESMLSAFVLKNIVIDLLISLLHISSEFKDYCGFHKVPHKSQFSRFKLKFLMN